MVFLISQLLGCSFKKIAVHSLANALTEGSNNVFAMDDDPQLVREALPFALKTMEILLQSAPKNKKLLIGTAAGFVQYSHAFVLLPADAIEKEDLNKARQGRDRAKRLFLRARNYGLRALEISHPGISHTIIKDPSATVRRAVKKDVAALYWTGVAWGSAISVAKDDMGLVAELPIVSAVMERALDLDEGWQNGAIHEFFIVFDANRSIAEGGGIDQAEKHFQRAMELNKGQSISPIISLAESVCVKQQDRRRFESLLKQVLDFDADQYPEYRLSNILARKKAKLLLENIDDLFI
jgi:predicted anti-sigma-YlaC factor YlaD